MTAIVTVPADHFSGHRAISHAPSGADVRSLEDILNELIAQINSGGISSGAHAQITAASETDGVLIAPADGEITYAAAFANVAAAAGESMTFDVQVEGVTVLTGVITVDDAATTAVVAGTLIADPSFSAGDRITVDRVYVAGGGPTPMTNTLVSVGLRFEE